MKLLDYSPDWSAEDWQNYYVHTWVLNPRTQKPGWVHSVGNTNGTSLVLSDKGSAEKVSVPVSEFAWAHLRHPKIGWVVHNHLPVFAVKRPLRQASKGFRPALIDCFLPAPVSNILNYFRVLDNVRGYLESSPPLLEFYSEEDISPSLENAVVRMNADNVIGVVVRSRQNILLHNPDPASFDEFPYVLAHGPDLAALVRKDLTVQQISNADLGDILYAD